MLHNKAGISENKKAALRGEKSVDDAFQPLGGSRSLSVAKRQPKSIASGKRWQKLKLADRRGSPEVTVLKKMLYSAQYSSFASILGPSVIIAKKKSKIICDKNMLESTANTDITSSGNYTYIYIYLCMRWLSLGFVDSNNQRFIV